MRKLLRLTFSVVIIAVLFITVSFTWSHSFKPCINPDLSMELIEYCNENNLCESHCIIVDFSIYSGKDRLFIIDLSNNEVLYSTLCAHGVGKNFECLTKPKFSNEVGSNLSSLGHFKLGRSKKTTQYDLNAIELHGLDSSNSNAYQRGILIHDGLPNVKIVGLPCLPLSQGCFTISSSALDKINTLKQKCNKPIMIYSTNKSIF